VMVTIEAVRGNARCGARRAERVGLASSLLLGLVGLGCGSGDGGAGFDAGEVLPDAGGVDGDPRDAGPMDAGPPDGGPPDAGPSFFGLPACAGSDPRVTAVSFTGSVEIDAMPPRTLIAGSGAAGSLGGAALVRFSSDQDVAWIAVAESASAISAERLTVDGDGAAYVVYRANLEDDTEAITFFDGDGEEGIRFTQRVGSATGGDTYPIPVGALPRDSQHCFVVKYDVLGDVVWADSFGFSGDAFGVDPPRRSSRGCTPLGVGVSGGDVSVHAYLGRAVGLPNPVGGVELVDSVIQVPRSGFPVSLRFDADDGDVVDQGRYWIPRTMGLFESRAPTRVGAAASVWLAADVDLGDPVTTAFDIRRLDRTPDPIEGIGRFAFITRYARGTAERTWFRTVTGGGDLQSQQLVVAPDGATVFIGAASGLAADEPLVVSGFGEGEDDAILDSSPGTWLVAFDGDGQLRWTQRFVWGSEPDSALFAVASVQSALNGPAAEPLVVAGQARGQAMSITFGTSEDAPTIALDFNDHYLVAVDRDTGMVTSASRHTAPVRAIDPLGDDARVEVVAGPAQTLFIDQASPVTTTSEGGALSGSLLRVDGDGEPACARPFIRGLDFELVTAAPTD